MNKRDLKKMLYKPIVVEFLDHALLDAAITCRAIGWLCGVDKDTIKLCYWDLHNSPENLRLSNNEYFTIVTKTITNIQQL